jgi:6-bladed beta-propeller
MKRPFSLLALALAFGCETHVSPGGWDARRDVAGDTTIVRTLSGQVWPPGVELVEDLAIGALQGPEELEFGEVSRLAEDPDGGIYVLDAHGPAISHFDRGGGFLGTVGRSGGGPGEYGHLSLGMVVDSCGTLYVHDWSNSRIARFAAGGEALDPWPLDSHFLTTDPGTWLYSDGCDRILVRTAVGELPALLRIESGRVVDTLEVPRLPGVPRLRGGPYRVDLYWGWNVEGYFIVGLSNRYSLDARRPTGTLRILREVPSLPVHAEEADAWRRQFEWMERHPAYRPPEGEWIPSEMPPFREIGVAADGRIWVRRNTRPIPIEAEGYPDGPLDGPPPVPWTQPYLFDVFAADGSFLGEVRFPDSVQPLLFGSGHVWGVRRGEFDEQYVVRLTLRGADSG